jgi:YcxB-like protein
VNISGTYTANDLVSAAWVHLRPRRNLGIVGIVLVLLALLAVWLSFFGAHAESSGWAKWVLPSALLYLALAFGVGIPYKARRAYKQRKDLQRQCSFSWSNAGLYFSTEGMAGTKPWADYLKWKEGGEVILLYLSDNLYQAIPKRFFASESDLLEFREFLSQQVPRREA